MKTLILNVLVVAALIGCQQAPEQAQATGETQMLGDITEASAALRGAFAPPAKSGARGAVGSDHPRMRVIVTWGGGLLSCAKWGIKLASNHVLYAGSTQLFEFLTDRAGRIDDKTVGARTLTCGHKDRGAVSVDVEADLSATLSYKMEDQNVRDGSGNKKISEGEIKLDSILQNGGYLPTPLTGGNFISVYAEKY